MRRVLLIVAVCILASCGAAVGVGPSPGDGIVYQAYFGSTRGAMVYQDGLKRLSYPYAVNVAVPGVLKIEPGHVDRNGDGEIDPQTERWSNFVSATDYAIKSVNLKKTEGQPLQCDWLYDGGRVYQRGTDGIRLWWPLMYEAPGTTWELTIFYTVPGALEVMKETWTWKLEADLDSVWALILLFRQLPSGLCEVPLIQDDELYEEIDDLWYSFMNRVIDEDWEVALDYLIQFEFAVLENCVTTCPRSPMPTGETLGIVNTDENPACCKLLIDAEYVGQKYGVFVNAK